MRKNISGDSDINFQRNGKFQNPEISGKLPVPTSREETLHTVKHYIQWFSSFFTLLYFESLIDRLIDFFFESLSK